MMLKEKYKAGSGTILLGTFMIVGIFAFIIMFMEIYQLRENYNDVKAATDTIADGTAIYAVTGADYKEANNKAKEISTIIKDEIGVDVGTVKMSEDEYTDDNIAFVSTNSDQSYLTDLFSSQSYSFSSSSGTEFTTFAPFLDYASIEEARADVASKTYSVLKALGWSNNEIAGALGNIQAECNFDFTSVETIFTEPFEYGPKKQSFAAMDYIMASCNPSYKQKFPKIVRCGIGLIAWTDTTDGATGNTDLQAYAKEHNTVWYGLEIQLAYLISYSGDSHRADMIRNRSNYTSFSGEDVYYTTMWWSYYIEGCFYDMGKRIGYAHEWEQKLNSGQVEYNAAYASRILSASSGE